MTTRLSGPTRLWSLIRDTRMHGSISPALYRKKGDSDRYIAENLKHAELHGAPIEVVARLKQVYTDGGVTGVLKLGLEFAAKQPQAFPAMQLAVMHGALGAIDTAFEYLNRAIESHDPGLVHIAVAPQWDCLRSDPRFQDALSRMGLSAVPRDNIGSSSNTAGHSIS